MSNALLVANVIKEISTGDQALDYTYQDKQLDAMTSSRWFQDQWEEFCEALPAAKNMSRDDIIRVMNCFTCMFPSEAASIMVSEDSNE